MLKVKVKEGFRHRVAPPDYDPDALPKGAPGPEVKAGEVIEVSEAEFESFGDKFELVGPAPKKRGRPRRAKVEAEAEAESDEPQED